MGLRLKSFLTKLKKVRLDEESDWNLNRTLKRKRKKTSRKSSSILEGIMVIKEKGKFIVLISEMARGGFELRRMGEPVVETEKGLGWPKVEGEQGLGWPVRARFLGYNLHTHTHRVRVGNRFFIFYFLFFIFFNRWCSFFFFWRINRWCS